MGNDTETLTLTGFLLARIAEDEEWARWGRLSDDPSDPDSATKILRWDHDRLRAECEAKRRIVGRWVEADRLYGGDVGAYMDQVLRALAAVYADHLDYDPGWRP